MAITELVDKLNGFAWGPFMLLLLFGTGIYLSIQTKFIQLTKFKLMISQTFGKKNNDSKAGELSPIQSLTTALAASVGTGNIAGVAGAITVGGPGAIFWMWISALFGMITKYAEVVLAIKYRERNEKGEYVGGPMYYIKNGLGTKFKWLATLFCIFGALAAFGIGNMTQVNTIANSINNMFVSFGYNPEQILFTIAGQKVPLTSILIGVVTSILVGLVLLGGMISIGQVAEKMVPIIAVIYVVC